MSRATSSSRLLFATLLAALCTSLSGGVQAAGSQVVAGEPTRSMSSQRSVEPIACPIEISAGLAGRVGCGRLRVPENRALAGGRAVKIVFAVIQPVEPVAGRPPILFIMGGNGSGMKVLKRQPAVAEFLSRGYTVIYADHRGSTPWGEPDMSCPRYQEGLDAGLPTADPAEVEDCRKHLSELLDVNHYGPFEAARDLQDLRLSLGIERWNVYGVSYGTTIGERLVAVDGAAIAALVLDGMSGVDANAFAASYSLDPLIDLLDECAASTECARAFPRFERQLGAVAAQLQRRPQQVAGRRVSHVEYLDQIRLAMADSAQRGRIPLAVERSMQGDFSLWQKLVDEQSGPRGKDPAFTWPASVCRDEHPRRALPERQRPPRRQLAAAIRDGASHGDAASVDWDRFCVRLGFRPSDAATLAVPVSDVPTLFLSGQLDLITPPTEVDASMRRLRNSRHVVFPLTGHWVLRSELQCAGGMVLSFFDQPAAAIVSGCVDAMPTTAWAER